METNIIYNEDCISTMLTISKLATERERERESRCHSHFAAL